MLLELLERHRRDKPFSLEVAPHESLLCDSKADAFGGLAFRLLWCELMLKRSVLLVVLLLLLSLLEL